MAGERCAGIGRRAVTAAFGVAALAVAGQALFAPVLAAEDWDKVAAAGKAEGRLVLYTAYVGQPSTRAVAKAFEARYGISVEVLEARASEVRERLRVEQAAGRFLADVIFTSEGQAKLYDRDDKTLALLPETPNAAKLKPRFRLDVPLASVMTIPYGILVNTRLVKPGDEPKSWADLADPKWKGKLLADDPRAVGGGYAWFYTTNVALGEEYSRRVAALAPVLTRDQRESQRRVARGEYALYAPFILTDAAGLKGLPVKPIVPEEGVPYVLYGNCLVRNAPHPNAARLYLDFLQGPEAQKIYAESGHGPAVEGIAEGLPPDVRGLAEAKLLGTSDPSRQDEMLAKAKALFP